MRLIDADALKKAIPNTHVDIFENCRNCRLLDDEQVKQLIDDTPTIELLKEQGKGKWIDHTFAHGDDIECPFCHKKWSVIDNCTETFDYCPGCGAKLT